MKIYVVIQDIDDYPECGGGEYPDAVFFNYANAEAYAARQPRAENVFWRVDTWVTGDEPDSVSLPMKVVRMLGKREDYFDKEWVKAENKGQGASAAMMLGKSSAYNSARQMLMAALTGNKEILREYDTYHEEEN